MLRIRRYENTTGEKAKGCINKRKVTEKEVAKLADVSQATGALSARVAACRPKTELLTNNSGLEALYCANDIMAIAAIDAAKALGFRVPEDISIVGFDDIAMADWPNYRLTAIQQPVDEMVRRTIELLVRHREEGSLRSELHMISEQLMERKSVRQLI